MGTPVNERGEPQYKEQLTHNRSSDDDGTVVEDDGTHNNKKTNSNHTHGSRLRANSHLTVDINPSLNGDYRSQASPSQTREAASRLDDDLTMLEIERQVSQENHDMERSHSQGRSVHRSRTRREEVIDEFDAATNPLHEKAAIYKPPENPTTSLAKLFKKIHNSSFIVRYFCYITPVVALLSIPVLLGYFPFPDAHVGCVELRWFGIWLEIVWLTLWAGRILAKCLPWPIGLISSLFTNNGKKWRDMGKQLELPATLFFWWLAIEVSFLPTMNNHMYCTPKSDWKKTTNKVLVSIFVGVILNFVEKIIIQLIAISFHLRTYADRIEINKFQIGSLAKLYKYSKEQIAMEDSDFEDPSVPSGARTPGQIIEKAQKATKQGLSKFGDVAGKIAGDFTGRQIVKSTHPHQVVLTLLSTNSGSQILARRLYRTFARVETETVYSDDLKGAFDNEEEADAAFSMFDKDMNGDISMEELEAVCVEIGRERKSITASLKDLDSVVSKLDDVFMFLVAVITILVFVSLISTSAAGVLTSAGSAVLALSWLFSATAQEFLQSIIFVFVKHPFDVGDRVGIYGNTGAKGLGDDYFVKEIALLYTEFKKMEGHVVQAPNSYLNTLFILNQRRSGGLAEAVPIVIKFGTTLDQIDALRMRLLEFVRSEKREYQSNILTELRQVEEAHSVTLNVVFFYKSNWQNELLRLQRRNKFICAMMVSMQELGIEGPRMRYPGQKESFPMYLQNVPHIATGMGHGGTPDNPAGFRSADGQDPPFVAPPGEDDTASNAASTSGVSRNHSILRTAGRPRAESLAAMNKRVDFSLGMRDISSGDILGDVYEERSRPKMPSSISPHRSSQEGRGSHDVGHSSSTEFGPGKLQRTSTSQSRASHHNRFFHRGGKAPRDEETGMADIPENDSPERTRIDARSGLISPVAIRNSSDGGPQNLSGALPRSSIERSPYGGTFNRTTTLEMQNLEPEKSK